MGASGAGKTSLLNTIADRIHIDKNKTKSGSVMVNDEEKLTQKNYGRFGAYVMQDDVLFEHFTVKECLTFASRLRSKASEEEQDFEIDKLIKELGIWNVKDTSVGSWKRKTISGGERKRCSIGVELIVNPSLIMLDEPTSGLDSWNALNIVKTL
jgi:ABC-type multidrug transport system ATPase subunit